MTSPSIETMYPLSPTQQGMIFHTLENPSGDAYFIQASIGLQGQLDPAQFQAAWRWLIARHAALRTSFHWEGLDQPIQVVHTAVEMPFSLLDWRDTPLDQRTARLDAWLSADRRQPFDIASAPLFRLTLIDFGAATYQFVWCLHHLILDGWSVSVLFQELFGRLQGRVQSLPAPPSAAHYIAWLSRQSTAAAMQFWRTTLSGFSTPTALLIEQPDCADSPEAGIRDRTRRCATGAGATLQSFAQREHVTLGTLIHAAWALALITYSASEDVVFGSVTSGRSPELPNANQIVGMLLTTLPVRVQCDPQRAVRDWLLQLQQHLVERRQFEYSALVDIQGWSDVPRGMALFETLLVFENYPLDDLLQGGDADLRATDVTFITPTNYALTMQAMFTPELTLNLSYASSRFSAATAERIIGHMETALHALMATIDGQLADIALLTPVDRALLEQFNATPPLPPLERSISSWIAEHAREQPAAIALRAGAQVVTYAELLRRTNQLARWLQATNLPEGTPIGVFAERDTTMPMLLLACLQTGYAYMPLNPIYPDDRLERIITDSQCGLIATTQEFAPRLPAITAGLHAAPLVLVWDRPQPELDAQPAEPLPERIPGQQPGTIFYTSGSTGMPKGAIVEVRGLLNHLWAKIHVLDMDAASRVAHTAAHSFDISVWQFLAALLVGGEVVIYPTELVLTPLALFQAMEADGITISETVPTLLEALLTAVEQPQAKLTLSSLRFLISNAELLPVPLVQRWFAAFPQVALLNTYGATECSDDTSHIILRQPLPAATRRVPVGTPIAGFALHIINDRQQPVPVGCPGQIAMCGVGVGQGYLGDTAKTSAAFVPNPFSTYPEQRMYLTGDLGRWREDGQLDFLGRTDGQIKVRGQRIELGEIDAALARCTHVRHCVTVLLQNPHNQPQLVAYLVGSPDLDPMQVSQELKKLLPASMLPDQLIALAAMPLNPNGKIDRRALPEPAWDQTAASAETLPQSPLEQLVAEVWSAVLHQPALSRQANFFTSGGHSLLATQIIARLRVLLDLDLPLRTLFEYPTIADLSAQIALLRHQPLSAGLPPLRAQPRPDALPLSFAQQRLWITNQLVHGQPLYTMPTVLRLTGSLDIAGLQLALAALAQRHESLRTRITLLDDAPIQIIAPHTALAAEIIDLTTDGPTAPPETAAEQHIRRFLELPFDLEHGPLARAMLLRIEDTSALLVLNLHHIITDGWSTAVLVRDLLELYEAAVQERPARLPELAVQYADYAIWQREWLSGSVLHTQESYWRSQLASAPTLLALPTDHPRPPVQTFKGALYQHTLSAELTQQMHALSAACGTTLFMTLLAGFQTLLAFYSGQQDVLVGVPIAGRNQPALDDLVGFFVNTLVIRTTIERQITVRELLAALRTTTLDAYAHQDVPFEHLVEVLKPERTLSHTPIYQVAFALQNMPQPPSGTASLQVELLNEGDLGVSRFDLMLAAREQHGQLHLVTEYSTDLFEAATIERFIDHYSRLLTQMAADPDQLLATIDLLKPAERNTIVSVINQTDQPYLLAPLPALIAQVVARQPHALALCAGPERRTYQELQQTIAQLAHALLAQGVQRGDRVGVFMQRTVDLIPMLLAVQTAGAAYVPLDPSYPVDRLMVMVEDSDLRLIIADEPLLQHLDTPVPLISSTWLLSASAAYPPTPPAQPLTADDLAYVIYTSGSTGRPKGIAVPHRGIAAFMGWVREQLDPADFQGVMASTSVCFDLSVFEFFAPLIMGGTVILVENGLHLPAASHQPPLTLLNVVPSVMNELVQQARVPASVRTINLGGEAVALQLVNQIYTRTQVRNVYNMYGPTEDTVYSTWCRLAPNQPVVIGRPLPNTRAYVLDPALRPLPIGVTGQLYLSGDGQARGYLGRPGPTAAAFIPDPFSPLPGRRMYHTGDLARLRPDYSIEYLGRIDFQIKIRGFRVELEEIESCLLRQPDVMQAVVTAHQHRDLGTQLVAYLVARPGRTLEPPALRAGVQRWLPDYMVPAAFMILDQLPLTLNGKVDRKQLPEPDESATLREPFVAPRTPTEATMVAVWSSILGVSAIGVNDNFFLLGGHSLLATQLLAQIRAQLGVELDLRSFFEAPTVAELARHADAVQSTQQAVHDAALLDQIDTMSDTEVAALLERLSRNS